MLSDVDSGIKCLPQLVKQRCLPLNASMGKTWPLLAIVFLGSFFIRVLFILETSNIPSFRTPVPGMDIDLHWQAAGMLLKGATSGEPFFELMMCSTPLHPYWLAFWRFVLGDSFLLHRMLTAFLSSFSALLIFLTVYRLIEKKYIATICGLVWAMLPSLIYFESTLYKSFLELLLLNILLWVVLSSHTRKGKISIVVNGVLIGLSLLLLLWLQMNTVFYFVVIVVFIWFEKNSAIQNKLILSTAAVIVLGSGSLIYHLQRESPDTRYPWFTPQKGVHMRIGFNERADGSYIKLRDIPSWPYGHAFYSRLYAETVLGSPLGPKDADSFFIHEAADFISNHPLQTFQLVLKKGVLFFNNHEVKGVDDLYYLKNQSRVLDFFPLGLGTIVVFAGLGAIYLLQLKEYRLFSLLTGLLTSMLVGNMLIFVTWRYRLHNIIPLILLASYGVLAFKTKTVQLFRRRTIDIGSIIGYTWKVLLPMLLFGIITFYPMVGKSSQRYYKQAGINDSLSQKAEKMICQLERIEREYSPSPQKLIQKTMILNKLHRHSQSYRLLLLIHERGIYTHSTIAIYLRYLIWLGDYKNARTILENIENTEPGSTGKIESKLQGIEKIVYRRFIYRR